MVMKEKVWVKKPIHNLVYQIIQKYGTIKFSKLMDYIREEYDNIDEDKVRTALMKLEIWDKIIAVSNGQDLVISIKK